MAVNLFQGADPSLVTAAARAGLATAPQSYARTFEDVAKGYATTMEATAGMWKSIFDAGTKIGLAIDKSNRLEAKKIQTIEDAMGTEGAKKVFEKLEGFKGGFRALSGIFKDDREFIDDPNNPGTQIKNPNEGKRVNPFSKETKDKRRKLEKEMSDYYAMIEKQGVDTKALVSAWTINPQTKKRLVNEGQTELLPNEWSNAIIQSQNDKSTDNGNRVVLEEIPAFYIDENDKKIPLPNAGDWKYVMYHDEGKVTEDAVSVEGVPGFNYGNADEKGRLTGTDGKVIRYSAAEVMDMLVLNDENKNGNSAMQTSMEGFFGGYYKGANGQDLLPYQVNELEDFLDKIKTSPKAWNTRNKFSEDGKSWKELMTSVSTESAVTYGQYLNVVGENVQILDGLSEGEKTELLGSIAGRDINFEDIDNIPGITTGDFVGKTQQHADNYKALTLALFNPGDGNYDPMITGEAYKAAQLNLVDKVRARGWERNSQNPANITAKGTTMSAGVYYRTGQGDQREIGSDILKRFNLFSKGNEFKTYNGVFGFKVKDGQWQVTGPSDPKGDESFSGPVTTRPISQYDISEMMGFNNQSHILGGWDPDKLSRVGSASETEEIEENVDLNTAVKKGTITTLDNDVVANMWMGGVIWKDIKKINGTWHVKTGYEFGENQGYTKATPKQIKKISKKYK